MRNFLRQAGPFLFFVIGPWAGAILLALLAGCGGLPTAPEIPKANIEWWTRPDSTNTVVR